MNVPQARALTVNVLTKLTPICACVTMASLVQIVKQRSTNASLIRAQTEYVTMRSICSCVRVTKVLVVLNVMFL